MGQVSLGPAFCQSLRRHTARSVASSPACALKARSSRPSSPLERMCASMIRHTCPIIANKVLAGAASVCPLTIDRGNFPSLGTVCVCPTKCALNRSISHQGNIEYRRSRYWSRHNLQSRSTGYQRETGPPDKVCLSFTHDRDYGVFKDRGRSANLQKGLGFQSRGQHLADIKHV